MGIPTHTKENVHFTDGKAESDVEADNYNCSSDEKESGSEQVKEVICIRMLQVAHNSNTNVSAQLSTQCKEAQNLHQHMLLKLISSI